MSKAIKIIVTALIIIGNLLSYTVNSFADIEDYGEFYPCLTVVTQVEQNKDNNLSIIYCQDKDRNIWTFYDDNPTNWTIGDICNIIIWNIGIQKYDNQIIEVYIEGHTEDINLFLQIMNW